MLTDAHFHPRDLQDASPGWEASYRDLGILGLASAHEPGEFEAIEALAASGLAILPGFGIHPQCPDPAALPYLEGLARSSRIRAIGECGFDAFDAAFRATLSQQECLFSAQLDLALTFELPLVIHLRKAMDAIFRHIRELAGLPSVIFHSWPGSPGEASALLERGINAFFSFGNPLVMGRKASLASLLAIPAERILSETDAPFQAPDKAPGLPARIVRVQERIAALRGMEAAECETLLEANFRRALVHGGERGPRNDLGDATRSAPFTAGARA